MLKTKYYLRWKEYRDILKDAKKHYNKEFDKVISYHNKKPDEEVSCYNKKLDEVVKHYKGLKKTIKSDYKLKKVGVYNMKIMPTIRINMLLWRAGRLWEYYTPPQKGGKKWKMKKK